MKRVALPLALVLSTAARADDVNVTVGGNLNQSSSADPRLGATSVSLSGTLDLNDALSFFASLTWTRDLPTTASSADDGALSSQGGNVYLFGGGAMVTLGDHVLLSGSAMGSPEAVQNFSTTLTNFNDKPVPASLVARSSFASGSVAGSWGSFGDSNVEHSVDASVSLSWWKTLQRVMPVATPAGAAILSGCLDDPQRAGCALVNRFADAQLFQARATLAYTLTLFQQLDVGLEGGLYVYDAARPSEVGLFGVLSIGREPTVGTGIAVNPLLFHLRPSARLTLGRATLSVAYQLGLYTEALGTNHLVQLRAGYRISRSWRASISVTGQTDAQAGQAIDHFGLSANVSLTFLY